jgi:streptogramin lyase
VKFAPKVLVALTLTAVVGLVAVAVGLTSSPKQQPCLSVYGGLTGGAGGMTLGPDGRLYAGEGRDDRIARFDVDTHRFTEYRTLKGTGPHAFAVGPDKAMWFTGTGGKIGRLNPKSGKITYLKGVSPRGQPHALVWARDGNLYWSEQVSGRVGRYDPRTKRVTESAYNLPPRNGIHGVAELPDGSVWWALQGVDKLGRFNVSSQRFDKFISFPRQSGPHEVEYDRKTNALYTTLQYSSRIAWHDLDTGKTTYMKTPLPPPPAKARVARLPTSATAQVTDLALDHQDKHMWVSTGFGGSLLRYDLGGGGQATVICGTEPPGATLVFANDRQGRLWVSEPAPAAITRVDP